VGILFSSNYKLKHMLPFSVKKLIYFSLIHSHLTYACEIWGHTAEIYIEKIFITQKKAVKAMNGQSYSSHSNPIFCQNFILPFRQLVQFQSCILIHNTINNFNHNSINLITNSNIHALNTRNANDLHLNRIRSTRYGLNSVLYKSKKYYNDRNLVPINFKNMNKLKFKGELKKHFCISFLNDTLNVD
jgi:hypothetical protein